MPAAHRVSMNRSARNHRNDSAFTRRSAAILAWAALALCGCGGGNGGKVPPAAPTLSSIAVTPAAPSVTTLTSTQQFTATGSYSDGSTRNLTSTVTWVSSAAGVATIDSAGLATATGGGSATITAASGGVSGSTTFSVNPAMLSWDEANWNTVYWQ